MQETGEEEVETERSKGSHLRFLNSHSKIYHAAVNYLKLRFDVSLVSASPPDYVRNVSETSGFNGPVREFGPNVGCLSYPIFKSHLQSARHLDDKGVNRK